MTILQRLYPKLRINPILMNKSSKLSLNVRLMAPKTIDLDTKNKNSSSFFKKATKFGIYGYFLLTPLIIAILYGDYKKFYNLEDKFKDVKILNQDISQQIRSLRCLFCILNVIKIYKINEITPEIHQQAADEILHLCKLNRGTYIKIGQHIGVLDFMIPKEICNTMKVLHKDAPQTSFDEMRQVLCEELNINNLDEVFSEFESEPLGTASLAQVYKATLKETGKVVAVKVQHPSVFRTANLDLANMITGINLASFTFPEFKLAWLGRVTRDNIFKELNFNLERENTEKASKLYNHFEWLVIPKAYPMESKRVSIMDFEQGCHIDKVPEQMPKVNLEKLMKRIQLLYADMIFHKGFIHSDPHPGNILVRDDEKNSIVLLDHGLYNSVDRDFRYNYASLWYNIITGNDKKVEHFCNKFDMKDRRSLNDGIELYKVLCSCLTNKDYRDIVEENGLQNYDGIEDHEKMGEMANLWKYDITSVLEHVPQPLILIFKVNDLLHSLEYQFKLPKTSSFYITLSEECIKSLRPSTNYKISKHAGLLLDFIKNRIYQEFVIWGLFFYKLKNGKEK